jgi:hypothetical protein
MAVRMRPRHIGRLSSPEAHIPMKLAPLPSAVIMAVILSLLAGTPLAGQVVRGRTLDAVTGEAMADVAVTARDASGGRHAEAVSNASGGFVLHIRAGGDYVLEAARIGYDTLRTAPLRVDAGEDVEVELRLGVRALALAPVTVVARRVEDRLDRDRREMRERVELRYDREMGGILRREDVLRAPGVRLNDLLREHLPGRIRCSPAFYLNGVLTQRDLLEEMSLGHIETVESYRGFSAGDSRFTDPRGCGVVLVWTREPHEAARPFSVRRLAFALGLAATAVTLGLLVF